MGAVLQCFQMPGVITPLPTVESLGADAEVPAGKTSIMPVTIVIVKPL